MASPKYQKFSLDAEIELQPLSKKKFHEGSRSHHDSDSISDEGESMDDRVHLAGNFRTFVNTVLSFIGAGILGLPNSFKIGGLWLSLAVLSISSSGSMYCMWLLVACRRMLSRKGVDSYSGVSFHALGNPGLFVTELSLVVTQASFSISYIIFIGRNINQIFSIRQLYVVLACLPPLVALSFFRHPKYLAPFSLFAELVNIAGLIVIVTIDVETIHMDHPTVVGAHWGALPFISGVFLYCFEGMGLILSLEKNAIHKETFVPILALVMLLYTSLCALMGCLGYLAYGEDTQDIILMNIDNASIYALVVKLCFCAGLYCTYPRKFPTSNDTVELAPYSFTRFFGLFCSVMMLPVWDVIEPKLLTSPSTSEVRTSRILRFIGVCTTGLVAGIVPSFSLFIGLIGSSCCALLAFILPPLAYNSIVKKMGMEIEGWRRILHCFIVAVGALTAVTGTMDSVKQLIELN